MYTRLHKDVKLEIVMLIDFNSTWQNLMPFFCISEQRLASDGHSELPGPSRGASLLFRFILLLYTTVYTA